MNISGLRFQVSGFCAALLASLLAITAPAQVARITSQQQVGDKLTVPSKADPGSPSPLEFWWSTGANALKIRNPAGTTTLTLATTSDLAGYQPLDSDLTAIAALTTTTYGRSFLTQADAGAARTYIGLGTIATETATDYLTKAGNLSGLGSTSTARTNLGVAIGTDVQAYNANLTTFAGITPSANVQTLLVAANYSAFRSSLGVAIGTDVQAYNANLAALSGLTSAADKIPYFTGSGTASVADYTDLARANDALTTLTSTAILTGNGSSAINAPGALLSSTAISFDNGYTSGANFFNTADQTSVVQRLDILYGSNVAQIGTRTLTTALSTPLNLYSQGNTAATNYSRLDLINVSGANRLRQGLYSTPTGTTISSVSGAATFISFANISSISTAGTNVAFSLTPTYNQSSGTSANTDLLINRTETAIGSGNQFLIQTQIGGSDQFVVSRSGAVAGNFLRAGSATVSTAARLTVGGNFTSAAWGANGLQQQNAAANYTDSSTATSGTATMAAIISYARPTLAASNTGVHTTDGATVYAANSPASGTNNTVDNPWTFWADAGVSRFDGGAVREAGGSAARSQFAGPLYMSLSAIGNVGTGEDDLISQTIAASVLAANGDTLRITTPVTFASNANNKTLKVYWNGTAVYTSGALLINGGACEIVTTITRTGSATQNITINVVSGNVTLPTSSTFATGTATLSGTVVFKLTGEATSDNDISEKQMICEYLPAP